MNTDDNCKSGSTPPAPITDMRIQKLKDGGFIVGGPNGGTFACTDICDALDYIAETLDPDLPHGDDSTCEICGQ